MKVIETAKIMAARTRFFDPPPVELVLAIATFRAEPSSRGS
jgi:hypothetical protein